MLRVSPSTGNLKSARSFVSLLVFGPESEAHHQPAPSLPLLGRLPSSSLELALISHSLPVPLLTDITMFSLLKPDYTHHALL